MAANELQSIRANRKKATVTRYYTCEVHDVEEIMTDEKLYEVFWYGPYDCDKENACANDPGNVLYQLYGSHHLYGRDVLLYIGRTGRTALERILEHEEWIQDEYDKMTVRYGSIGEFDGWKNWEKKKRPYASPLGSIVEAIEALLIYANQPAYNSRNKANAEIAKGVRIFNSGKLGHLLPEVSYKYFLGE
jgi:hypothetical protein